MHGPHKKHGLGAAWAAYSSNYPRQRNDPISKILITRTISSQNIRNLIKSIGARRFSVSRWNFYPVDIDHSPTLDEAS